MSQNASPDPSPHPGQDSLPASSRHLILGAGPVGRATASLLAGRGHEVVLASRSGTGPELPGVGRLALDAADAPALTRAATGAAVIYNCMNPGHYTRWETEWPPLQTVSWLQQSPPARCWPPCPTCTCTARSTGGPSSRPTPRRTAATTRACCAGRWTGRRSRPTGPDGSAP